MSARSARLLLVLALPALTGGVVGCTRFQPVKMDPGETWSEARAEAARAARQARTRGSLARIDDSGTARHLVLPGETVGQLAQQYGVPSQRIIAANNLKRPYYLYAGQVVAVPGVVQAQAAPAVRPSPPRPEFRTPEPARAPELVPAAEPPGGAVRVTTLAPPTLGPAATDGSSRPAAEPTAAARPPAGASATPTSLGALAALKGEPTPVPRPQPIAIAVPEASPDEVRRAALVKPPALSGDGFQWPVAGRLASGFGDKPNGQRNDGINIAAPAGSPVRAAEHGVVVYAGSAIAGFGNMLLVRHAGGFTTAYAHLSTVEAAVGEPVRRGQVIGRVGATGDVTTPQLHFELRAGRDAVDPKKHLVGRSTEVASRT